MYKDGYSYIAGIIHNTFSINGTVNSDADVEGLVYKLLHTVKDP